MKIPFVNANYPKQANAPSRGFYERFSASEIPADLACYAALLKQPYQQKIDW